MDKIIAGFSTAKKANPLSTGIKILERTKFSHCYFKFYSSTYDIWMVYHASHTMIHFMSEERFLEKNKIICEYEIDLREETKIKLIRNAIKRAGVLYGMLQIVGMLKVRLAYLWFGWKIKNPFADGEKTQVCSDLLYYELRDEIDFGDFEPELDGPRKMHEKISISPKAKLTFAI